MKGLKVNIEAILALRKEFDELDKDYVDIGIFEDEEYEESGEQLLDVAATHELGVGKIPKRSFLEYPIRHKTQSLVNSMKRHKGSFRDSKAVYDRLGRAALYRVQEAFRTKGFGSWRPLNQQTIKNKRKKKQMRAGQISQKWRRNNEPENPLIDTGLLRRRIKYRVKGQEAKGGW